MNNFTLNGIVSDEEVKIFSERIRGEIIQI